MGNFPNILGGISFKKLVNFCGERKPIFFDKTQIAASLAICLIHTSLFPKRTKDNKITSCNFIIFKNFLSKILNLPIIEHPCSTMQNIAGLWTLGKIVDFGCLGLVTYVIGLDFKTDSSSVFVFWHDCSRVPYLDDNQIQSLSLVSSKNLLSPRLFIH